jgi:cysteine desulfurase / selenocysteine lyase
MLDTKRIRKFFPAIKAGRLVSNNAASAQVPVQLLDLLKKLVLQYDNVHRGQSKASLFTTQAFEASYDTIAQFIGAPSRKSIVLYRNTSEAVNAVMYSLLTEIKDGDNVVTTLMEHNSDYVPWYGLCKEILPKFGINVEYRLVRYDKETGKLDLEHLKSLVDERTKIVCCVGASNFLGTINPIKEIKTVADRSGYIQPDGEKRSYFLVDGAQLVPNMFIDVEELGIDFLAWSFHKMLAPFGVGALYGKEGLLSRMRPFLYGGDMIAEGKVSPEKVEYNDLPWKFTVGTPNILGTILSAQALRLLVDFALNPGKRGYFLSDRPLEKPDIKTAMDGIKAHEQALIAEALGILGKEPSLTVYGPKDPAERTALVAFTDKKVDPFALAKGLDRLGVESRAGCHCATLAHYYQGLNPPASCRLSFYVYNDLKDVQKACSAVQKIVKP